MLKKVLTLSITFIVLALFIAMALIGIPFNDIKGLLNGGAIVGGDFAERTVITYTPAEEAQESDINAAFELITKRLDALGYLDAKSELDGTNVKVTLSKQDAEVAKEIIASKGEVTFANSTGSTVVPSNVISGAELIQSSNSSYPYSMNFNFSDGGASFYTATTGITSEENISAQTNYIVALLDGSVLTYSFYGQPAYGNSASFPIGKEAKEHAQSIVDYINLGQLTSTTFTSATEDIAPSFGSNTLMYALCTVGGILILLLIAIAILYKKAFFGALLTIATYNGCLLLFIWGFSLYVTLPTFIAYLVGLSITLYGLISALVMTKKGIALQKSYTTATLDAIKKTRKVTLWILIATTVISLILMTATGGKVGIISDAAFAASVASLAALFATMRYTLPL